MRIFQYLLLYIATVISDFIRNNNISLNSHLRMLISRTSAKVNHRFIGKLYSGVGSYIVVKRLSRTAYGRKIIGKDVDCRH